MKSFKNKLTIISAVIFMSLGLLLSVSPVYAVNVIGEGVCDGNGSASVACEKPTGNPLFGQGGVLTFAINIMTIVIGIAAVIMIILAGLKLITSGSNPQEVSKAREMVLYAVVGVIIAVSAQVIVRSFISIF